VKHIHFLFLSVTSLLLWMSCTSRQQSSNSAPTVYSEDSAMAHFLTEPDRSLMLLDSATIVGNLTPQRSEYLKAMVLYSAKDDADSCIAMCQRMIDNEAWEQLPDTDDVLQFQIDLYRLMANAAHATGNVMGVARYCGAGIRLAHGVEEMNSSEADMLSRMGLVLCEMGQYEEGLDTLNRAKEMLQKDQSWSGLVAYFNLTKKLFYAYDLTNRHEEAKSEVFGALKKLDNLRININKVKHVPTGMLKDSTALEEFIAFNETSFHSYLVNIYTKQHQQDSVQYWLERFEANPQNDDASTTWMIIEPLIELGRYDEAQSRITELKKMFRNDTICDSYVQLLRHELRISMLTARTQEADRLVQRIFCLNDSIEKHSMRTVVAHATTQLQLQDEQQLHEQTEQKLLLSVIALVSLLALVISITAFYLIRRLRVHRKALEVELDKTHEELDKAQEELEIIKNACTEEKSPDQRQKSLEDIYRCAQHIMETQKPFMDPKFDINALAALVQTNRLYLSNAINSQSGVNYRTWLAQYRIEYAKTILQQNPDITNDQLADACGFDNRVSLYRHFKNIVGMTPNEWTKTPINN